MNSHERAFQYEAAVFTEYENSISSSRYLRLSAAEHDENNAFPYIFTKRNIINGPNNDFLELKMPSDLVFAGFHVLPQTKP